VDRGIKRGLAIGYKLRSSGRRTDGMRVGGNVAIKKSGENRGTSTEKGKRARDGKVVQMGINRSGIPPRI